MCRCAVRYSDVKQMAADPRITSLRRSERAVWRFLSLEADSDGVIRKGLSTPYLARRVEYQPDTVRKAVRVLVSLGLCRMTPGIGRTRSLYAVPIVLGAKINEPEGAPPASAEPAKSAGTPAGNTASSHGASTASAAPASGSSQQTEIPMVPEPSPAATSVKAGIPRQSSHNDVSADQSPHDNALLPNRDTAKEPSPDEWCEDARKAGRPHKNRRCCHNTTRERTKRALTALAAERRARAAGEFGALLDDQKRREEGKTERIVRGVADVRAAHRQALESAQDPRIIM